MEKLEVRCNWGIKRVASYVVNYLVFKPFFMYICRMRNSKVISLIRQ